MQVNTVIQPGYWWYPKKPKRNTGNLNAVSKGMVATLSKTFTGRDLAAKMEVSLSTANRRLAQLVKSGQVVILNGDEHAKNSSIPMRYSLVGTA